MLVRHTLSLFTHTVDCHEQNNEMETLVYKWSSEETAAETEDQNAGYCSENFDSYDCGISACSRDHRRPGTRSTASRIHA